MNKREQVTLLLRSLRGPAFNLALGFLSLGVAGLVAEGVVRLAAPQQLILIRPDLWQPADSVGWLHRPNVSTKINTGERTVSVFTDADGFRVGEEGRLHGNLQILLLGDSFMEALQVEHAQSTAGLLESALGQRAGTTVAVHNAGIGGWGPSQYSLRARSLLARGGYDLVITAVYLGNDIVLDQQVYFPPRSRVERHALRVPHSLNWSELTDAILRPLNDALEVRSHLFLLFKNRLLTLRMQLGLAPLNFPRHFMMSDAESGRWSTTADILGQIDSLATAAGSESMFVLIPAPFQVDSASLAQYVAGFDLDPNTVDLEQPNKLLGEELSARGLNVFDALPAFRAAHTAGEQLFGTVDPHFSPAGHRLFAGLVEAVASELVAR